MRALAPGGLASAALVCVLLAVPRSVLAQNQCDLVYSDVTTVTQQGTLGETIYIGGPVIECVDGSSIVADSAVITPPLSVSRLMGNVRFAEVGRVLTSDSARYQTQIDRLFAWGRVSLTDSTGGSDIKGDTLIYLRGGDLRPEDHLTVLGQRVEATLVPAPDPNTAPAADSQQPYLVTARRSIVIQGESSFEALGEVQLERGELRAYSDTARYQEGEGTLILAGSARAQGEGYELSGKRLTVILEGEDVRQVLAQQTARLDTEDVDLTAPLIRIFVQEQVLQRLVAGMDVAVDPLNVESAPAPNRPRIAERFQRPAEDPEPEADYSRATAVSEEFLLRADSLDMLMPDEVLDRALAIGMAHGESFARDSLNAPDTEDFLRHDWLDGDTVIAVFTPGPDPGTAADTPAVTDTAGAVAAVADSAAPDAAVAGTAAGGPPTAARRNYVLQSLTALGNARSMYRMAPADSVARPATDRRLAVHYVVADAIVINMVDGEVSDMETVGATRGLHLEPGVLAGPAPADTVGVPLALAGSERVRTGLPGNGRRRAVPR